MLKSHLCAPQTWSELQFSAYFNGIRKTHLHINGHFPAILALYFFGVCDDLGIPALRDAMGRSVLRFRRSTRIHQGHQGHPHVCVLKTSPVQLYVCKICVTYIYVCLFRLHWYWLVLLSLIKYLAIYICVYSCIYLFRHWYWLALLLFRWLSHLIDLNSYVSYVLKLVLFFLWFTSVHCIYIIYTIIYKYINIYSLVIQSSHGK